MKIKKCMFISMYVCSESSLKLNTQVLRIIKYAVIHCLDSQTSVFGCEFFLVDVLSYCSVPINSIVLTLVF